VTVSLPTNQDDGCHRDEINCLEVDKTKHQPPLNLPQSWGRRDACMRSFSCSFSGLFEYALNASTRSMRVHPRCEYALDVNTRSM